MKLAIMQPYLFPYAGYFNLIGTVDNFVFYDDVNFIKNGWINRNRLFLSGDIKYFTIPLSGASPNLKIADIKIQPKRLWEKKFFESIKQSYSKAPNFALTFDLIRDILDGETEFISSIAKKSIIKSSQRLGFPTHFIESSSRYNNVQLNGVERVLDICAREKANEYINLPGGKTLYNEETFDERGITLSFVEPILTSYSQFERPFAAGLSIIDMMMFNSFDDCRSLVLQVNSD